MFKDRYIYRAKVVRVVDGDTYDVNVDLGFRITARKRLRLVDVDTPEIGGLEREFGLEVKQFVKDLIEGYVVTLETFKTGKNGRYLAEIYVGGVDYPELKLSELLLSLGYGERYE